MYIYCSDSLGMLVAARDWLLAARGPSGLWGLSCVRAVSAAVVDWGYSVPACTVRFRKRLLSRRLWKCIFKSKTVLGRAACQTPVCPVLLLLQGQDVAAVA